MKIYFAPLEGITRFVFRNAYEAVYGGIDKYFDPFVSPTPDCTLTPRNKVELVPEHNPEINLVPQILTNRADCFAGAADEMVEMGYQEINLNLGCPSGTVTAKHKGAGALEDLYSLEQLLDGIFNWASRANVTVSVKSRLGRFEAEEFQKVLDVYNEFPISELILHPRVEKDYYKGIPRIEWFDYALEHSKNPVVYNGNIFTAEDLLAVEEKYQPESVMLGRGLIFNPQLLEEYANLKKDGMKSENGTEGIASSKNTSDTKDNVGDSSIQIPFKEMPLQGVKELDKERFWKFHNQIYKGYQAIMSPDRFVLMHMKELWTYWRNLFPGKEREIKNILKSKHYSDYEIAVNLLKMK